MEEKNESITKVTEQKKPKKSWRDFWLVPLVIAVAIVFFGQILGLPIRLALARVSKRTDNSYYAMLGMYLMFLGVWALCLLYMWGVKYNRPIFKALWTKPAGNSIRLLLWGLLVGFGMNMVCAIIALLHKDIILTYDKFRPVEFFTLLIVVFIQSSAEELICRGFIYQRLRKGYKSPWVAIILNPLLFAVLHLANPGVTVLSLLEITLVGFLFSLSVYYFDSIWFAMAAHCAWNFTQNILLGLPNSGIVAESSVFTLDAASAQDSFAYSTSFGIEGTITAVLVTAIACMILWKLGRKRNKLDLEVWNV